MLQQLVDGELLQFLGEPWRHFRHSFAEGASLRRGDLGDQDVAVEFLEPAKGVGCLLNRPGGGQLFATRAQTRLPNLEGALNCGRGLCILPDIGVGYGFSGIAQCEGFQRLDMGGEKGQLHRPPFWRLLRENHARFIQGLHNGILDNSRWPLPRIGVLHLWAAVQSGIKGGATHWHNPFEGLKPAMVKGAKGKRTIFTFSDIEAIIRQPFLISGDEKDGGGKGLAARWLPLLSLFTGARRRELAQLMIEDVRFEDGVTFLKIIDTGEGQSVKTDVSIRRVPVHPELVRCGFLKFVEDRKAESKPGDWLFEGLVMNRKDDRGDAWGRWFGRKLRELGLDAGGRKVYHSFRHTFIARCREAEIEEELRVALTGHSDGGSVGRRYGGDEAGFRHSLSRLQREMNKITYPGVDFSHLYKS